MVWTQTMRDQNPRMSQLLRKRRRKILMYSMQKWRTSKWDFLSEDDALWCFKEYPVGTERARTWDYGLKAPGYVHQAGIKPQAKLLVREQWLDSPNRLRAIPDKNVNDICHVVRKPAGKNANGMPNRWQQVSVIAQENLQLFAFPCHHKWRWTLD